MNLAFRCTDTSDTPLADSARLLLLISIIRSHEWGRRSVARSFSDVLVSLAPILIERPERIPEVIKVLVRLLPDDSIALATGRIIGAPASFASGARCPFSRGDSVERRYLTEVVVRSGDRQWQEQYEQVRCRARLCHAILGSGWL